MLDVTKNALDYCRSRVPRDTALELIRRMHDFGCTKPALWAIKQSGGGPAYRRPNLPYAAL
jgi:hypothetical protein